MRLKLPRLGREKQPESDENVEKTEKSAPKVAKKLILKTKMPPKPDESGEPAKPAKIFIPRRFESEKPKHPQPITRENFTPTLLSSEEVKALVHPCSHCGHSYIWPCDGDKERQRTCLSQRWVEEVKQGKTPTMPGVKVRKKA